MSILETFYILFKGDASDVKKGAKEAQAATDNLEKSLQKTKAATAQVGEKFLEVASSFKSFIASAVSVGTIISGIKSAANYSYELDQTSKALDVNVEALDAWGNAVQRTGGTAQGFQSSIRGLAQHVGTSTRVALNLLPQLADSFQRMNRIRALNYGKMLGLDEATILLLMKGRKEVDAIISKQKELGVVSKRDIDISEKFNFALMDLSHAFRSVFMEVNATVLPILTKLFETFIPIAKYLRQHSDLVIGGLYGIAAAAIAVGVAFGIITAEGLIVAGIIALLIGLIAAVYEDIKVWIRGGDSLIGAAEQRWPKAFKIIKAGLEDLKKAWKWLNGGGQESEIAINSEQQRLRRIDAQIATGEILMKQASNSPFASHTSNSINNRMANTSQNVQISEINIVTQATDAEGIGSALGKGLSDHIWQANSNFDDGRLA